MTSWWHSSPRAGPLLKKWGWTTYNLKSKTTSVFMVCNLFFNASLSLFTMHMTTHGLPGDFQVDLEEGRGGNVSMLFMTFVERKWSWMFEINSQGWSRPLHQAMKSRTLTCYIVSLCVKAFWPVMWWSKRELDIMMCESKTVPTFTCTSIYRGM